MSDEKKKLNDNEKLQENELNLEDLEKVTGGSLADVSFTETVEITDDIIERV